MNIQKFSSWPSWPPNFKFGSLTSKARFKKTKSHGLTSEYFCIRYYFFNILINWQDVNPFNSMLASEGS
jgi:hypothetical protein